MRTDSNDTMCHWLCLDNVLYKSLSISAVPEWATEEGKELRPMDMNVTAENDAVFRCQADAVPAAAIQWYKNGDPFDSKSSASVDSYHSNVTR